MNVGILQSETALEGKLAGASLSHTIPFLLTAAWSFWGMRADQSFEVRIGKYLDLSSPVKRLATKPQAKSAIFDFSWILSLCFES